MSGDSSNPLLSKNAKIAIVIALVVLGIVFRILPHPPNFAPITAIALFGATLLPKNHGLWLPLAVMIISDFFIGFHDLVLFTWGSFLLIAFYAQKQLRGKVSAQTVGFSAVGASIFFFLATNFGVWLQGSLYPRTLQGLADSYVAAIPFFRNTLLGDLFFVGLLFGAYYLAVAMATKLKPRLIQT